MVAQTVAGEGMARVWGPWGEGLTFGKRQRRNGLGCWGRSCGGCPGGCYLWQKEGDFRPGVGGNPIRPPDPQSGFQTAACLLLSLISPVYEWATYLSCGPSPQNVLATKSAQPLLGSIPPFSGEPRPLRMALLSAPSPFQTSSSWASAHKCPSAGLCL